MEPSTTIQLRLAQVQTGLLAGILAILVVIALKPASTTTVTTQSEPFTANQPIPVRIVYGVGSDPIDVRVLQGKGFTDDTTLKVEVTNPTCGHSNRGTGYTGLGAYKDDGPCYVTVAP